MPSRDCLATTERIRVIIDDCLSRIARHGHQGFDPADLFNSQRPFIRRLKGAAARGMTLVNFYSPVNLRRLLRIAPAHNTTAMVLWGLVHLKLFKADGEPSHLGEAEFAADWLKSHATQVDGTLGWSRIIDYQSGPTVLHDRNTTLTFINANAAMMFLELYEATSEDAHLRAAQAVCDHLLLHTNRTERPQGCCLSYNSTGRQEVFNASILAGAALNRAYGATGNEECLALSGRILSYTLARQNEDGSWYYSWRGDRPKKQIDFHQCYMLEGIESYRHVDDTLQQSRNEAFARGTRFYIERMFDLKMRPYWRYPLKYPIDIHNVAHGVYFLSKYRAVLPQYEDRLAELLRLHLEGFYDEQRHFFYYQKYPLVTVRHDFFRWNTMWSLLALSEYLLSCKARVNDPLSQKVPS